MADLEYEHMLRERYRALLDELHEERMEVIRLRGELATAVAERDAAIRTRDAARDALREVCAADVREARRPRERAVV